MIDRALLVELDYSGSYYAGLRGNVGLSYLSEWLSRHGIEHAVFELPNWPPAIREAKLFEAVEQTRAQLIGFSMKSFRYLQNYQVIDRVKRRFPDALVVVGGPHASTFRAEVLNGCPGADVVVAGEGEDTLLELCAGKPFEQVRGILFRSGGGVTETPPRPVRLDLDALPFPRDERWRRSGERVKEVCTSRGCPAQCIFCPCQTTIGRKWRRRSAQSIADEIEYHHTAGQIRLFSIADDNFTLHRARVVELCAELDRRKLTGKVHFVCMNGVRADRLDRELLVLLKDHGFVQLSIGVESASERVLQTLRKGESLGEIRKAIEDACQLGFLVRLTFVLGSPGETEKEVLDSIALAREYPVGWVNFYHLIPFPGTPLYSWVEERGLFRFPAPQYLDFGSHWVNEPLFTTPELDAEARKRLFLLADEETRKHCLPYLERSKKTLAAIGADRLFREKYMFYRGEGSAAEPRPPPRADPPSP